MENKIQIFKNSQFGEIRTITNEQGEAYVAAIDVCKTLGYSNPRDAIKTHVDIEDVAKYDTLTNGGIQHVDPDDALKQGLTDSLGRLQETNY